MDTLVEADLDPGTPELKPTKKAEDVEDQYRNWLLSLDLEPQVGRKRCAPSVSSPARLFLLQAIETPEGVRRPPAWVEPLAWLSEWKYPGNVYLGSRALKLRAFVTASVMIRGRRRMAYFSVPGSSSTSSSAGSVGAVDAPPAGSFAGSILRLMAERWTRISTLSAMSSHTVSPSMALMNP